MTSPKKPYRRFRAHGRADVDPDAALDAIRDLETGEDIRARKTASTHEPRRRTPAAPRPERVRPAWWSLRGRSKAAIARRVALGLVACVVVWALAGFLAINGAAGEANSRVPATARQALSDPGGGLLGTAENILVIGSDRRSAGGPGRADTIMIMRTVPDSGRINYLSIPRDLRVPYGSGHVKITEIYVYDGVRGVVSSIKAEIGLPIHHVLIIDFDGVTKMVDAVGGIELNNPFRLQNCPYPPGMQVSFRQGNLKLDGKRALQYARVRKCDGDIQRAQRQQLVVAALRSKLLSFSGLPFAPFRGATIVRSLTTDMGTIDLTKFGWLQARLSTGTRDVLATQGASIGGKSYQLLEPDRASAQVRAFTRS